MPWAAGHALGGAPSARAAPSGRPCAAQGLQAGWPGRMLLLRPGMWHCPPSQMVLQRRPNAFIVGCSGSPAGHGAAAHSALPHAVAHPSRWPRAPGRHTGQSSGSCAHERGMGWGGGGALRGRPCAQHSVGPVGEASARTPQPGAARLCPPGPGPARHHAAPIVQAPGSPVFSPQTPTQTPPPPTHMRSLPPPISSSTPYCSRLHSWSSPAGTAEAAPAAAAAWRRSEAAQGAVPPQGALQAAQCMPRAHLLPCCPSQHA